MKHKSTIKKTLNSLFRHRKIVIFFLFLLVFIPVLMYFSFRTNKASSSSVTFVRAWGSSGAGDGQLNGPVGIAISNTGKIYVTDSSNTRVQEFDASGNYVSQWGSAGASNGQFSNPVGITTDSSGNVYVADQSNHRIEKFDASGNYLSQWGVLGSGHGQFNNPSGIAIDSNNNIFVVDTNNHRIQKFDASGNYLSQWGSIGTGSGRFDFPLDIAIDKWNNVYVADTNNNKIQKFDSFGNFISEFGSGGSGNGQFSNPAGITTDSNGNVYVTDQGNSRIQRFDKDGNFILTWGTNGSNNSEFSNPNGITADSSGNIYVVDTGNNRIQEFSISYDLGPYQSLANTTTYRGSGDVNAILKVGNIIYLGGGVGLEAMDASTGAILSWNFNIPNDPLTATTPAVLSLAYSQANNTLYAGTSNGILAFDVSTDAGELIPWAPTFVKGITSGFVKALAISGTTLYAGGSFDSINGNPRINLATFDISTPTGVLTNTVINTNSNSQVFTLININNNIYIGGYFTNIGGIIQAIAAEYDTALATISATFNPTFDNDLDLVRAFEEYNGQLYMTGRLTTVNGNTFNHLVRVDETTGAPDLTFTPTLTTYGYALAVKDNYLYVGESNQNYVGDVVSGGELVSYNLQTDAVTDWLPQDNQAIHALLADTNSLYVGLVLNQSSGFNTNKTIDFVKNMLTIPSAYANIGGINSTIFLAQFDVPTTSPTPSPIPTASPTPAPTSTPTPASGSPVSAPVCSNAKPGAPTNVTATAGPSSGQITLTWGAPSSSSSGVTDYSITYSDNATSQKWGVVSTGNVTSYIISALNPSVKYYFWVNAVNGCMPGDPTGPASVGSGAVNGTSGATTTSVSNVLYGSGSAALSNSGVKPLPATGPQEMIKIGAVGLILTIIGGALLLAL